MAFGKMIPPYWHERRAHEPIDATWSVGIDTNLYDHVWYVHLDEDQRIVDLRLAYGHEDRDQSIGVELLGQNITHLFPKLDPNAPQALAILERVRKGKPFERFPLEIIDHHGQERHYSISGVPVAAADAGKCAFTCRVAEVTTKVIGDRTLQDRVAYFINLMRQTPSFIVIKDIEGRYVHINPTAEQILGVSEEDAVGRTPAEVLAPEIAQECAKEDFAVLEAEQLIHLEQTFPNEGESAVLRTVKFPAKDQNGCLVGLCTIGTDVTKFKSIEQRLYQESNFDPLTEIPNRHLVIDRSNQALASARRQNSRVGLIVVDLGKFSAINDAFGADSADQLLVEATWRLRSCTRETDTVARVGGDKFAILMVGIDQRGGAERVADKVFRSLRLPFSIDDRSLVIAPSIGVSVFPDDADSASGIFANAESALKIAKSGGRNVVKFYNSEVSQELNLRQRIGTCLTDAVARDEFTVVFQPLIDPRTGCVASAEALLRWNNAQLGQVGPDRFIPIAEENGQIHEIGEWVLQAACQASARWNSGLGEGIPVAVNVSPKQVAAHGFTDIVDNALRRASLDPAMLKIEITETAFAQEVESFRATFRELSDMGIAMSLDDFGTGYSSLGYLSKCPFDVIKIDRSFLTEVTADPESQVLLENIVRLAKSMKLTVVAEGVENDVQVDVLKNLHCDQLQGFRFSKPLAEDEFLRFVDCMRCEAAA